jgi:uncharacterized lipoprotein YddW (UPF0748 family)
MFYGDDLVNRKIIVLVLSIFLSGCVAENVTDSQSEDFKSVGEGAVRLVSEGHTYSENEYEPLNYDNVRGIWISYIDLAQMLTGKSEEDFRENFEQACENISSLGCNTIYVHVRPFGDALYNSDLYPLSAYVTGTLDGQADFDPLEIICDIAHSYDLSVHGWINPLRCQTAEQIETLSTEYPVKQWYVAGSDKTVLMESDNRVWLNPAYEEVRQLIADGAAEICRKYQVDGIHMDDYFYPTTDKSFDSACFAQANTSESLGDWRRENISEMCREIYSAVKSVNQSVLVGISPQGSVWNNYNYMYADVSEWCSEKGYCDYIVPQIYFGYNDTKKPFEETLEQWGEMVDTDCVKLICGIAAYKIGTDDEFTDSVGIIASQIRDTDDSDLYSGEAIYSYGSLFECDNELSERISEERRLVSKEFDLSN